MKTGLMFPDNIRNTFALQNLIFQKLKKSHDVYEIALLACESLGAMMGEDTFYNRQKQKIMEEK